MSNGFLDGEDWDTLDWCLARAISAVKLYKANQPLEAAVTVHHA